MQINSLNHRNENNGLFGLLPWFLAYKRKSTETSKHQTEAEVSEQEKAKSNKEINEAQKKFDTFKAKIKTKVGLYNTRFDTADHYPLHKKKLTTNVTNSEKLIEEIDAILIANFQFEDKPTSLKESEWKGHEGRKKALLDIRKILTNSNDFTVNGRTIFIDNAFIRTKWNDIVTKRPNLKISIPHNFIPHSSESKQPAINQLRTIQASMKAALVGGKISLINKREMEQLRDAKSQVDLQLAILDMTPSNETMQSNEKELNDAIKIGAQKAMTAIRHDMETALRYSEEKSKLQKKPIYAELSGMYDRATTTPVISAGREQFKRFWTDPEYGISTSNMDESKNLFFSILRRETDNFKSNFILGDDFGEDSEENKLRFPMIYEAWIEYKGFDKAEIDTTDKKVADLKAEINAKNTKSVHDIAKTANNTPYQIGLDISKYTVITAKNANAENFDKNHRTIGHYIYQLKEKMQSADDWNDDKTLSGLVKDLELRKKLAYAEWEREKSSFSKTSARESFTKSSLAENQQLVMELAMRKFHKAMEMVDEPSIHGNWKNSYNPSVRRSLIATLYDEGVSEFRIDFGTGKPAYVDNLKMDSRWMMTVFANSPHYNRKNRGEKLSKKSLKLLPVAHLANKITVDLENYDKINKALEASAKWVEASGSEKDKIEKNELSQFPQGLISIFKKQSANDLRNKITEHNTLKESSEKFLKLAVNAINNPESEDATTLIKDINDGVYKDIITGDTLKEYSLKMMQVEADYRMFELDASDKMDFMEAIGINIEGTYLAYKSAINTKPENERYEHSVENWDNLMNSDNPEDFEKLMFMMGQVIADGRDKKGKEDFLKTFRAMHVDGFSELGIEHEASKAHVMNAYFMIKEKIKGDEKGHAKIISGEAEFIAKLEGETLADKGTRTIKKIVNMLVGPGQSWANRGAGLILIIAALKAAHSAYKGETKSGKFLRVLFVAGAVDLALKEATGKSGLERLGFETIMGAQEGMSEAVLVNDGTEHMDDKRISPEEQTRALYELRKVPFKDVMAWYMDPNTNKEGGMVDEGRDDKFPDGIDLSNIVIGEKWENYDEDIAGRIVVMQTIKHFFEYTARKNGLSPHEGGKMLEDRWVKSLEPNYKPKYTRFTIPPAVIAEYKKKPDELTWGLVIDAEISQKDRDETVGTHGAAPTLDYFAERGAEFIEWGRQTLLSPATNTARSFRDSLGNKAEAVADFVDKLAEKGKTKVHFGVEGMKLKWEEHEIEIRNFLGSNVELIWEGVKFFPSAFIGLNQWAVPGLLAKIKQGKEILFANQVPTISGEVLEAQDIVNGDKILLLDPDFKNKFRALQQNNASLSEKGAIDQVKKNIGKAEVIKARNNALKSPFAYEVDKNPSFEHLGFYQKPFMEALNAGGNGQPMYYENNTMFDKKVGYFISETTVKDAGAVGAGYDTKTRDSKMVISARNQAIEHFRRQHTAISLENVENMLFPVHAAVKSGPKGVEKRYTFWRMPIPGGEEFNLRANGHWADTKVPDKYRHPFYVDPSRGAWGNIKEAYGADSPATRKAIAMALGLSGRVGGVAMSTSERLGKMGDSITNFVFKPKPGESPSRFLQEMVKWSEPNKQMYDEITGLAGTETSARSAFYRNSPKNQSMYKALRDFAIATGESYYYGVIQDRPVTDWDNPEPTTFRPPDAWEAYYTAWLIDNHHNPDGTRKGAVAGARGRKRKKGKKRKKK